MLSIDEAIANEIEMAEGLKEQYECMMSCSEIFREQKKVFIEQCKHDSEEHEQLAEWLEELKALREEKSDFQIMAKDIAEGNYEMGMENGYNKALDDFVTIIKERVGMDWEWDFYFIGQIAEQLKAKNNK